MVVERMSNLAPTLPDDPAHLKALIAALQAENAKISATLRAHDQLIQTLRLRIAKLKKQVFGQSSEKIEREIEQLELALEDLLIASAESETVVPDGAPEAAALEPAEETADRPSRRRRGHEGFWQEVRLQRRYDDRSPSRSDHRRRDRRVGRVLLVRHERLDPNSVGDEP